MNIPLINFNSGLLSPLIDTRSDVEKYSGGCRDLTNLLPRIYGCVERRPGTEFIAEVKDSSKKIKLVPFQYSDTIAYICEFGDSYIRFYYDGAVLTGDATPDNWSRYSVYKIGEFVIYSRIIYRCLIKSGWKNHIISHYKLDDNLANTNVIDSVGSLDGTATADTSTLSAVGTPDITEGRVFDFDGTYAVEIDDTSKHSFGDGTTDKPFSISALIYVTDQVVEQIILAKWDSPNEREWDFYLDSSEKLTLTCCDKSTSAKISRKANAALSTGWHFVFVTYDGRGGSTAANGITFYDNGTVTISAATNNASYVAMENLTTKTTIGAFYLTGVLAKHFQDKIDNVAIFDKELTSAEITAMYKKPIDNPTDWTPAVLSSTYPICETPSPYPEADLFELQFRQSADVMWIVHPDYAPRKLSRTTTTSFDLSTIDFINGPFLPRNDLKNDDGITITPSATTGSITLTASSPIFDSRYINLPGALFKIRHARAVTETSGEKSLDETGVIGSAIDIKGSFTFNTHGKWTGTVKIQRNENDEGWETYRTYIGNDDRNIQYTGTENANNVQFRINVTAHSSGTIRADMTVNNSVQDGICRIDTTGTVEPNGLSKTATATVLTDFASTGASKRWWEGAWSAYRGYPTAFAFFEERGVYAGTSFEPQNIWLSASGNFEDFETGTNNNDPFTLTLSSDEANQIRWLSSLEALVLGTIGGEWRVRATALDEALTPTNFNLRQQSTRGSKKIQPILVGTAVLFVDYVGRKIREMTFSDPDQKFVTPDLSSLAEHITLTGITSIAYQRNPDNIVWCTLADGTLISMTYERDQNVVAWAKHAIAGTGVKVESVTVISGTTEDEVWISVLRTIDDDDTRYIERLSTRVDVDIEDAHFTDSALLYEGMSTTITDITNDDPGVVTVASVEGLANGNQIYISGIEGMTELNGNYYTIQNLNTTNKTFELNVYSGGA